MKPVLKRTTITASEMVEVVKSSWGYIVTEIATGRHPDPRHLARALLGHAPLPREARVYLAGIVLGKKRPNHRLPDLFTADRLVDFADTVDRLTAICRASGGRAPQRMALDFLTCQLDIPSLGAAKGRYAAGKRLRAAKKIK